ncbi:hypothetical protein [Siccibacter turicensis]|uniref:DUF7878 domain-containing protein n=1 Tax=Siccibacter turicensis TaxID=357233 RepID=UPI000B1390A1|nr:hypothetical protein [Siccibacter turicensis]
MERIPGKCEMIIQYKILSLGPLREGPQLLAEVEGELIISIKGKIIFSEKGILLLEFAKELSSWLSSDNGDFLYESMDFEDSPILFFKKQPDGLWLIGSVWDPETYPDIVSDVLKVACKSFINELIIDLKSYGLDCECYLQSV